MYYGHSLSTFVGNFVEVYSLHLLINFLNKQCFCDFDDNQKINLHVYSYYTVKSATNVNPACACYC